MLGNEANVGIGTTAPTARFVVSADSKNSGENTATFRAPNIGPNQSHIHYGTTGDWYIRSAASSGRVILQDTGGSVLIGGNLTVNGTFSNPSDVRLKRNISSLNYGLSEVMKLRPVVWQWKSQPTGKLQLGMIAQEVEPVMPELVERDVDPNKPLLMNYIGFVPVMVKAIQQQQEQIKQQQDQINSLKQLVCLDHPGAEMCKRKD